jgi:hypothetical protein
VVNGESGHRVPVMGVIGRTGAGNVDLCSHLERIGCEGIGCEAGKGYTCNTGCGYEVSEGIET